MIRVVLALLVVAFAPTVAQTLAQVALGILGALVVMSAIGRILQSADRGRT